jgi:hypothetical protein
MPPPLPSFSICFKHQVVVVLPFLVNLLNLLGEFFQVVRGSRLSLTAGVLTLSDRSAIFFQRVEAFALRGLRVNQILQLAVELVNLLLRRGVLRARERSRENENKKPERNFSHAPKINPCAAASS